MGKRQRLAGAQRIAPLVRALRGGDAALSPTEAAQELARYRDGRQLLAQVAASGAPGEVRAAAVYGFVWGPIAPAHLALVRRIFANEDEEDRVRGQAAEVLGWHYSGYRHRWQRRYRRVIGLLIRGLDDPAPEVRFWSIYALAGADDARILPKLRLIADADTAAVPGCWTLRQEALWSIGWMERGEDADPRTL